MEKNTAVFRDGSFALLLAGVDRKAPFLAGDLCTVGIRPESLHLASVETAPLTGRVLLAEPRGPEVVLTVEVGSARLKVVSPATDHPGDGAAVGLTVDYGALVFFGNDNRRLDVCSTGRLM